MKRVQGTLDRYIRILEILAPVPAGLTLNEIIIISKLPRGTVHRLVKSLAQVGFLISRTGRSKIYVVGPQLLRLLYSGLSIDLVVALSRPLLEDLANQLGETVFLSRLNGHQIEKVAAWMPKDGGSSYIQPSRILPPHAAATAKIILAYQDKTVVDEALSGNSSATRRIPKHPKRPSVKNCCKRNAMAMPSAAMSMIPACSAMRARCI